MELFLLEAEDYFISLQSHFRYLEALEEGKCSHLLMYRRLKCNTSVRGSRLSLLSLSLAPSHSLSLLLFSLFFFLYLLATNLYFCSYLSTWLSRVLSLSLSTLLALRFVLCVHYIHSLFRIYFSLSPRSLYNSFLPPSSLFSIYITILFLLVSLYIQLAPECRRMRTRETDNLLFSSFSSSSFLFPFPLSIANARGWVSLLWSERWFTKHEWSSQRSSETGYRFSCLHSGERYRITLCGGRMRLRVCVRACVRALNCDDYR